VTLFTHRGHACPVTECPHNRGKRGLSCGFASDAVLICLHPRYKARWQRLTELKECEPVERTPAPVPHQMGMRL